MSEQAFDLTPERSKAAATFLVTHKPGATRLDGFPLLVYSPINHGPEVATEDNQTPVSTICAAAAETPDLERLAAMFKTTVEHVRQALAYALTVLPTE
jgi:hypothetical protein